MAYQPHPRIPAAYTHTCACARQSAEQSYHVMKTKTPPKSFLQPAMGAKFLQERIFAYCLGLCACLILQNGGAEAFKLNKLKPVVPMKKYTVDLDQPPSERWNPILKDFKSSAPLIVDYFNEQVRETCIQHDHSTGWVYVIILFHYA